MSIAAPMIGKGDTEIAALFDLGGAFTAGLAWMVGRGGTRTGFWHGNLLFVANDDTISVSPPPSTTLVRASFLRQSYPHHILLEHENGIHRNFDTQLSDRST